MPNFIRMAKDWLVPVCRTLVLLLGVGGAPLALASDGIVLEPLWDAPQGPAAASAANAWLQDIQRVINSSRSQCPQAAPLPVDSNRAARAYRIRMPSGDGAPVMVYLQDPVVSTFVVLWHDRQGCIQVYAGGRWLPSEARQFLSPFPNVRLSDWSGGDDVQVLIQDDRLIRPWIRVASERDFLRDNTLVWMLLAAIGVLLVTVILTMWSYAAHSRTVAAYVTYVCAFLWWVLQEFGVDTLWLFDPMAPAWFVPVQCVSVALVILGIGWTMLEFLALKGVSRRVIGSGQLISAAAFVGAIWWPPGYRAGSMVLAVNAMVTLVFLVRHQRGSNLSNKLFTVGFTAAMIGGGWQSLSVAVDLGPLSNFAVYAYAVGGFLQVLFWLVAIADRLRRERNQLVRWRQQELEQRVAQATFEVTQKKEIAEEATRAKSDFLAAASHDLRQPTHAMGMLIARLGQFSMNAEMRQVYSSLEASAHAIQELLDELMDFSILEAATQKMSLRPTALAPLLASLQQTLAPLAAAKGLTLRICSTQRVVYSDPVMLRRMVQNLALNAIRYTERGAILITCRLTGGGHNVRIDISDSGIGIAPDQQQHVFKEFYQVGNAARDRQKGIGLGLSIVQRSAQLLGHELALRSNLGCGSRFSIAVPLAADVVPVPEEPIVDMRDALGLDGLRVMLVEDDAPSREALTDLLVSWGCDVHAFGSGAQAQRLTARSVPDFILSDFRLDETRNGIEVIADLREQLGQHIPACLISGDLAPLLGSQARDHNIMLLHKPVRPAKLRSMMRRIKAAA